jgi:endonuclease YncB( thermonuclease family)
LIDGNTLELAGERVRLIGIDVPEGGQLCQRASG